MYSYLHNLYTVCSFPNHHLIIQQAGDKLHLLIEQAQQCTGQTCTRLYDVSQTSGVFGWLQSPKKLNKY